MTKPTDLALAAALRDDAENIASEMEEWANLSAEASDRLANMIQAALKDAVAAEREACARAVEKSYRDLSTRDFDMQTATQARSHAAASIRNRGAGDR